MNDSYTGMRMGSLTKRVFDFAAAASLLLCLAPVLLAVAAMVRITLGSPVFFTQRRPGRKGKLFQIVKFRTMRDARDERGAPLPDHVRLTPFGRFLRSSSLDELPELWNVLRGDMSLVGPRPLLVEYLPRYSPRQARRHEVRPGITGWAQIKGRNAIGWNEKLELDVWYVENRSIWLDVKILCLTLVKVVKRDGISHEGHATMPPFMGESKADEA